METKPILVKAGDTRVLVNGKVMPIDFRIISEDNYQGLLGALKRVDKAIDDMKLNDRFGHTQQYIKQALK